MQPVFIVTASRTTDGRAVYLTAAGTFTERLDDARWTADEASQAESRAWAAAQQVAVCDPYVMRAQKTEDGLRATSARERIRAAGPRWIAERFGYAV